MFKKLTTRRSKNSLAAPDMHGQSKNKSPIQQTRRINLTVDDDAPPAYSPRPSPSNVQSTGLSGGAADSPYAFLGQFDTIFVIDDSGSMSGRSWRETSAALGAITPICTEHDTNGIDIYFLNHRNPHAEDDLGGYANVTTTPSVHEIFKNVRPMGGTPTGTRLNAILKRHLADLSNKKKSHGQEASIKPLNIIVITDGVATDDVESAIVSAARKLDKMGAEPWQVGIQFFQVGQEPEAAEDLRELDDALAGEHGVRDMVDTVPWSGIDGAILTAEGIMKATMGAINRKLDRKKGTDARLRK